MSLISFLYCLHDALVHSEGEGHGEYTQRHVRQDTDQGETRQRHQDKHHATKYDTGPLHITPVDQVNN